MGGRALSPFRIDKLSERIKRVAEGVRLSACQWLYPIEFAEDPDGQAKSIGRSVHHEGNREQGPGQDQDRKGSEKIEPDHACVGDRPARVGRKLDEAMDRNRLDRLQKEQHHRQEHGAPGHAEHRRDDRGRDRRGAEYECGGRLQDLLFFLSISYKLYCIYLNLS